VNAVKANTMTRNNLALMQFTIEVSDLGQLKRLVSLIEQLPNVITTRRM
jgi:GTP pyrophosphokinase